jgi:AcrR family transcriptional regulator
MPRSGAEARARLREAALELYAEHGYDATTTAAIAERAGVTERTYFRHFADKREVLFDGEAELVAALTEAVAQAEDATPFALVLRAYDAAVPLFVAGRSVAVRRAAIIETSPALQERAHAKAAALDRALTDALVARGSAEPAARLAVRAGAAVFERALRAWDGRSAAGLRRLVDAAADELRAATA